MKEFETTLTTVDNIDSVLELSEVHSPVSAKAHPSDRRNNLRWVVLVLTCIICLGNDFCKNQSQSLQVILKEKLDLTFFQHNLMYLSYSLPNIILPILGGFFINRYGLSYSYKVFCFLLVAGQGLMTMGASQTSFDWILLGQVLYSFGGDCVFVAHTTMIAKWFKDQELTLAIGIGLCVARLGSSISGFVLPDLFYSTTDLHLPYLVGFGVALGSLLTCFILGFLDKSARKIEVNLQEMESQEFRISDPKSFTSLFYLLIVTSGLLFSSFIGLTNNLSEFMIQRFAFTSIETADFIPIIYLFPILLMHFLNKVVDVHGKRVLMIFVASLIFLMAHMILATLPDAEGQTDYPVVWVLLWIGFFFAVYTAVYLPSIALIIPEKSIPVGFGMAYSLQNFFAVIVVLGLGTMRDTIEDSVTRYLWMQLSLAAIVVICIILIAWTFFEDRKTGRRLNKSRAKLEKWNQKLLAAKKVVTSVELAEIRAI